MSRIKILSRTDIQNYERMPEIIEKEWTKIIKEVQNGDEYFSNLRLPVTKVIYIVQYGYFKYSQKLYPVKAFNSDDLRFVSKVLDISFSSVLSELRKQNYYWRQNKEILRSQDYKPYQEFDIKVQQEIRFFINKQLKPRNIFEQVVLFLKKQRVELPRYDRLQKDITKGLNEFEEQLSNQLKMHLDGDTKELLDQLLKEVIKEDQNFTQGIKTSVLTQLKVPNQSIRPSKIAENITSFKTVAGIFGFLLPVMEKLNFSPAVIAYHASWTIKARLFQIQQLASPEKRYLHLLSFINHQYKLRQDNFVEVFLNAVKNYQNFIDRKKNEGLLASLIKKETVKKFSISRNYYKTFYENVIGIVDSPSDDGIKLDKIIQLVGTEKSHRVKIEVELDKMEQEMENKPSIEELYYTLLQRHHRKLLAKVGNIIEQIEFVPKVSDPDLMEVISFYKENSGDLSKLNNLTFLTDKEQEYVLDAKGKVKNALCKVLLMFKVEYALKSGTLNLKYSYKYLSFEDYLFDKNEWREHKKEFLCKAGMEHLEDPLPGLNNLKVQLDNA